MHRHHTAAILVTLTVALTNLPPAHTGQSPWTVVGRGVTTTYARSTGGFELFVEIDPEVEPGEIGVTFLLLAEDSGRFTITRETTRFLGADATGTLYLELAGSQTTSGRRDVELAGADPLSLQRYAAALAIALRDDDPDQVAAPRRIMLPTITPDAAPAFQWVFAPRTLPVAPFARQRVTFNPEGTFEIAPRDGSS